MARAARLRARKSTSGARAPARARGRGRCSATLGGDLARTGQTRGHWTEGRRYLSAAVALGADLEPERLVNSLWGASILAQWQGDIDEGEQLAYRILEISQTAVDREHVYEVAIHLLAIAASKRSERDQALALLEKSLAIGRRGGDQWLLAIALNNLGNLLMLGGEYERATELFEESLAIGEARGDLDRRARALQQFGSRVTSGASLVLGTMPGSSGLRTQRYRRTALQIGTEWGSRSCPRAARWGVLPPVRRQHSHAPMDRARAWLSPRRLAVRRVRTRRPASAACALG